VEKQIFGHPCRALGNKYVIGPIEVTPGSALVHYGDDLGPGGYAPTLIRATRILGTALVSLGAGIPAAIAYVTSDTSADSAATAFLFAIVASGDFWGLPSRLPVQGSRGILVAAGCGAIAHKGAGREGERRQNHSRHRRALARRERELGGMRFIG
jgi:hypothetical protein